MAALRYAALVALAVWIGGAIVVGAVVAPTAFAVADSQPGAPGRMLVGMLVGEILQRFHHLTYLAGAVLLVSLGARRLLGPRPSHFAWRLGLASGMLAATLYSGLAVTGQIRQLQADIGVAPSTLPPDDPRGARLWRLHQLSSGLWLAAVTAGLVLVGFEMKD